MMVEIGVESRVEFGAGTEGAVLSNPDDLLDVSANLGPFSVDEVGRVSFGFGGSVGASVGYEIGVGASWSIPDTVDALMDAVMDAVKDAIDAEDAEKDEPEKTEGPD